MKYPNYWEVMNKPFILSFSYNIYKSEIRLENESGLFVTLQHTNKTPSAPVPGNGKGMGHDEKAENILFIWHTRDFYNFPKQTHSKLYITGKHWFAYLCLQLSNIYICLGATKNWSLSQKN